MRDIYIANALYGVFVVTITVLKSLNFTLPM